MSIEVSPPAAPPRANASGEFRSARTAGRTQTGDASPLGFLAALSVADGVVDAAVPAELATGLDIASNSAVTPVDIGKIATDFIAISMQSTTALSVTLTDTTALAPPLLAPDARGATKDMADPAGLVITWAPVAANANINSVADSGSSPFDAPTTKHIKSQAGTALASGALGAVDAMRAHDAKFFAVMDAMKSMASAQPVRDPTALSLETPATLLSTGALPGEKYLKREAGAESAYAHQMGSAGAATYAITTVVETPTLGPDMGVAEQIAFWISTDVHKAELKLDGIGKDAVEVSIRMNGNEAHVAFRTDELQARSALEGAADHLKELLQREGLVLTGVSVGTSGSPDTGADDRKQQQERRQTASVVVQVSSSEIRRSAVGIAGMAGRTLDLFV